MVEVGPLVRTLRRQGESCGRNGSPLYAGLLAAAADDVEADPGRSPVADVLTAFDGDPGPAALPLRLLGHVHRLVLERRAPGLGVHYPSVGGRVGDPAAAWQAFRATVAEHADELRAGLGQAPQTNEVGRATSLVGGLLWAAAEHPLPVRLVEIGASGGLNLRADAYAYGSEGRLLWGPPGSPVQLLDGWSGALPPVAAPLRIADRIGYDVAPVDVGTPAGRVLLTSYVWPDMVERLERLRGAFAVAERVPARVERRGAAEAMGDLRLRPGTLTVVWHSIVWQYLDPEEQAAVRRRLAELAASATDAAPFAHLELEPRVARNGSDLSFVVSLTTAPGARGSRRELGEAAPHGVPTSWRPSGADRLEESA